ncbi:MAG: hypothetical protein ACKVSF_14460, partial [Alphaproteobacteria bacterium]
MIRFEGKPWRELSIGQKVKAAFAVSFALLFALPVALFFAGSIIFSAGRYLVREANLTFAVEPALEELYAAAERGDRQGVSRLARDIVLRHQGNRDAMYGAARAHLTVQSDLVAAIYLRAYLAHGGTEGEQAYKALINRVFELGRAAANDGLAIYKALPRAERSQRRQGLAMLDPLLDPRPPAP